MQLEPTQPNWPKCALYLSPWNISVLHRFCNQLGCVNNFLTSYCLYAEECLGQPGSKYNSYIYQQPSSSECIVSAIGNTINNNAITVSGPNLGTHCIHIHNTHLQQTQAVSCKDIGYIYTVYYWKFCRNGDPAILNEQFQWVGEWF